MKIRLPLIAVLGLATFVAGCQGPCSTIEAINAPALSNGSADFSRYASLGTSISSGWQSGGLVQSHQYTSFPTLFARQIGRTVTLDGQGGGASNTNGFSFPAVSPDGLPALLRLQSLSPLVISNAGRTNGASANASWPTAFHNMAVPYSIMLDAVDSTNYYATVAPPLGIGRPAFQFPFFENAARHRGTILAQALSLAPTFMSIELGANEVLGYGTAGGFAASLFPPANYAALLSAVINTIHGTLPNTKVALFNVPVVTGAPFFSTFSPITQNVTDGTPLGLLVNENGTVRSMLPTDYVLLTAGDSLARGTGFPASGYNYLNPAAPGNNRPLRDDQVLSGPEADSLRAVAAAMNAAVDSVSLRPFVVKVDLDGMLAAAAVNGLQVGLTTYTTDFVTGGLFSLDGVHPTDVAHAAVANLMIDAVNARFGSTVPRLNVSQWATGSSSRMRPARGERPYEGLRLDTSGDWTGFGGAGRR